MMNTLTCSICGAALDLTDAERAPAGTQLRYHADFAACVREWLYRPALDCIATICEGYAYGPTVRALGGERER